MIKTKKKHAKKVTTLGLIVVCRVHMVSWGTEVACIMARYSCLKQIR